MNYYNEIDPYAANWTENLILEGLIPDGKVDRRSIVDVQPDDLIGFTQAHFFCGIAGWPLALRLAGWPEDREVWTGSPPCQPFSSAGKQRGTDDERHLWPHLFRLIRARRPATFFGEQVAAAIGLDWLDRVFADLEGSDYACRAFVLPACAVNAPHRRDRLAFVGHSNCAMDHTNATRLEGLGRYVDPAARGAHATAHGSTAEAGDGRDVVDTDIALAREGRQQRGGQLGGPGRDTEARAMGDTDSRARAEGDTLTRRCADGSGSREVTGPCGPDGFPLAVAGVDGHDTARGHAAEPRSDGQDDGVLVGGGRELRSGALADSHDAERRANSTAGYELDGAKAGWVEGASDTWPGGFWIIGYDGKARRVEPGIRLLADGVSGRVAVVRTDEQTGAEITHWYNRTGALRAFGNAIVPPLFAEVIGAYLDVYP